MKYPVVSIIGRPNVGKSSLLNKVIGKRHSIVDDRPGVTRDRIYANASWLECYFTLIDTGGIFFDEKYAENSNDFQKDIEAQVQSAIEESDLILFMVNVEEGITPYDHYIANELKKYKKPVILVVNKVENQKRQVDATEFWELCLDSLHMISAIHGNGLGDLLDEIVDRIPKVGETTEEEGVIPVAIVGKPNVGKSSLFNRIIGKKRAIVSDISGTTRDTVDQKLKRHGNEFKIVDTAGIRKKSRINDSIENYSVLRSVQAISRADVAILVIDATEPISEQDKRIAGIIQEEGKGAVIVVNKWDLVEKDTYTMNGYEEYVHENLGFLGYAPILFTSAETGQRVQGIFDQVLDVYNDHKLRIPTPELNKIIEDAVLRNPPPSYKGKRLKISYVTQPKTAPPLFLFFVNNPDLIHFSYRRYLENKIREKFGFSGVQIRMSFRKK